MWQSYVFSFLAGAFAANGIPHFIKGGIGQRHQTPFGKPSSAAVNVCWGWINFIVAAVFLHFSHVHTNDLDMPTDFRFYDRRRFYPE